MKGLGVAVSVSLSLLALAGSADGASTSRDFAVGAGTGIPGMFGTDSIRLAAHQTSAGARGRLLLLRRGTPQGDVKVRADVYCIAVSGNLARVSGTVKKSNSAFFPIGSDLTFEIQDNGPPGRGTPDAFSFGTNGGCTAVSGSFGTVSRGNLTVHDAI
jgi:hypothetical protein